MRAVVGDVMRAGGESVVGNLSLEAAHARLRDGGHRHLCVTDAATGALLGVLSDREVWRLLTAARAGRAAEAQAAGAGVTLAQVMPARALPVTPETALEVAMQMLVHNGMESLPVMRGGQLLGILTQADCLTHCARLLDEQDTRAAAARRAPVQSGRFQWTEVLF